MRVAGNPETFVPFELTLVVETAEDARALFAIFNHTDNVALLKNDVDVSITNFIKSRYPEAARMDLSVIANGVTYDQFYGVYK